MRTGELLRWISLGLVCVVCLALTGTVQAGDATADGKQPPAGAEEKREAAPEAKEEPKKELTPGEVFHRDMIAAYMEGDWDALEEFKNKQRTMYRELTHEQRNDLADVRKASSECRPDWWEKCRSSHNTSFKAKIWGRSFTANYMPTEVLGISGPVGIENGKLIVIVSWRPEYIDNDKPLTPGAIPGITIPDAEKCGFTLGTMGEVVAWHELGHNHVSISLSAKQVVTMFEKYRMLYQHLQEFYADMTVLAHASPKARLFSMKFRAQMMNHYETSDAHQRGCGVGVGTLVAMKFLSEPDKWPSVHFPGKFPEGEAPQVRLIQYLLSNIEPTWTFEEDRALREYLHKWTRKNGDRTLRSKGRLNLQDGQTLWLLANDDRKTEAARTKWYQKKLKAVIDSGRADDPKKMEQLERDRPTFGPHIEIRVIHETREAEPEE